MGLWVAKIEFTQGIPTLEVMSKQYLQQTGLVLKPVIAVHLASGTSIEILHSREALLAALAADAAAVAEADAQYNALLKTQKYEAAAVAREKAQIENSRLNHIIRAELTVDFGYFYPIWLYTDGNTVIVNQEGAPGYAVTCFVKCLVDLGGHYLIVNEKQIQVLRKRWQRLKRWDEYSWYNRPRK